MHQRVRAGSSAVGEGRYSQGRTLTVTWQTYKYDGKMMLVGEMGHGYNKTKRINRVYTKDEHSG